MVYGPPRYSAVPWLTDMADLRPMGPPDVCFETGDAVAMQLLIVDPFGKGSTVMLSISTEDWRTKDVTVSVGERVASIPESKPVKKSGTTFYPTYPDRQGP